MEEELEKIVGNFMTILEDYEQRKGITVKLFRTTGCRDGQINVEIEKTFGTKRPKN